MTEIKFWKPVGIAWERMVDILFRPFDFEKWMVMGFAAWIAGPGAGGGGGGGSGPTGNLGEGLGRGKDAFAEFWAEYGTLILTVGSAVLLVGIVIGVALAWVHARGKFIFLDNVIHNRAAIVEPWKKYRKQGNSLFLWNMAVGFIAILVLLVAIGLCAVMIWPMCANKSNIALGIVGIVFGAVSLIAYCLVFGYIGTFVYDFVVPIMLKYDIGIREAWSRFFVILKPGFWKFILYGLVRYLLGIGIGMAVMTAYIITCCCLLFVAAIPYIGTVLLLPVFVFYRCMGLEFMRQFGDEFSVDATEATMLEASKPAH
ncbi:MAG: hypothetical protein K9M45_12610 [Kiritimatiellales bacterium]|nr:hypothetical protein [Kiritimatiellales bacterium]